MANAAQRRAARRIEAGHLTAIAAAPCDGNDVEWLEAAASGDAPKGNKKFSGTAYSGGILYANLPYPTVVDIAGLQTDGSVVSLLEHMPSDRVGHITAIDKGQNRKVKVTGEISASGAAAQTVVGDGSSGYPWQLSIAGPVTKKEFVEPGKKVTVNGRSFTGPLLIAREMKLREVSFCAIGADAATSLSLSASAVKGSVDMEYVAWLEAKGFDEATLTEGQASFLKASYESELKAKKGPDAVVKNDDGSATIIELKAQVGQIQKLVAQQARIAELASLGLPADLQAKAINEGWSKEKAELEHLRASRPNGPSIHVANRVMSGEVLEAALCVQRGHDDVEKRFKPEVLEASHTAFKGRVGLQQVILTAAASNGYQVAPGERLSNSTLRDALRACFLTAGFSGVSLPNILSNVANKELLMGYMEEDQSWREISRVTSVSDFKQATSYRLLDSMEYEQVGAGGKIAHGKVDEEYYTRQAKTYAKMFSLDRVTIINDDLSAFDELRTRLGAGAAKKFNNVFWAKFMDNSAFFTSGRTNYLTGSTTNLGSDGVGLGLGVKQFRKMTSPSTDGAKRVGGSPSLMLVPPELEGIAENLYRNQNLGSVAASSANIYANKYRPIVVPWLSDSTFTGYSDKAWYLLRAPQTLAPMAVSFLNGVQTPTVESADASFDTLGVEFRGYHDFGCDQAEYLAGLKVKGEA